MLWTIEFVILASNVCFVLLVVHNRILPCVVHTTTIATTLANTAPIHADRQTTYICKYKTATDRHSHTYMNRGDLPTDRWMEHQLLRVSFLSRNGNEMMRGGFFYLYWLLFASKTVKILHKKLALFVVVVFFAISEIFLLCHSSCWFLLMSSLKNIC